MNPITMPAHPRAAGLPPGSKLPALAQTAWYLQKPRSYLDRMRKAYGDTLTVRALNGVVVIGCTPEHAKQLFTAPPDAFEPFGASALAPLLGEHSVLLAAGAPHRRQRKLLQPPVHGARLRAFGTAMRDVAREHLAGLHAGSTVRFHEVTTAISLDVILRTVFGLEPAALASGRTLLRQLLAAASPWLLFAPRLQRDWFAPWRRMQRARAAYDAFVAQLVRSRRERGVHGEDVLGLLLDASWDDGEPLGIDEIRDQLLTLLVAGHETTAVALAWAVHDLYAAPEVLARLRAELAPLGSDPEPEALARLPLLAAICDESLRLRPVVADVIRTLRTPFEYAGYSLPAGIAVGVAIESIHADPEINPDPDAFFPDRFVGHSPGPFEFLPFGGGHRRCLGAAFSEYEARIVLGTIAASLQLEPGARDQRVRRNITMGPKHGVPMRVARLAS